ncbi:thiol peroxidase [Candidatus Omnitrophota bacterium]
MPNVTFQGNHLTLEGSQIEVGKPAPAFTAVDGELKPVTLADFEGKVKVINTFPSIDTPVCNLQLKEFNKRATSLGEDVVIIAVSKDLPFALNRFCEANSIANVKVLSDYQESSLGLAYGLLIKELKLLTRSIVIVDKSNTIQYIQIVDEIANEPNYDEAMEALKAAV